MEAKQTVHNPPFKFLRVLDITTWTALHYAVASFIMFRADPSPVASAIEDASHNVITHDIFGMVFAISAIALLLDTRITPRKFRLYLIAWLFYVVAAVTVAFRALISGESIPGIYLATLAYLGELVYMLLSYSVLSSAWNVAGYIVDREPLWMRMLNMTDVKGIDRPKK